MANWNKDAGNDLPSTVLLERPTRLRALIVEDEPIVAMELETLLEELDADVVGIAMSAAEVGDHVMAFRPDFVTMDINIRGDRDGVTVAQEIFDTYGVRSIFVSAYSDVLTRMRAAPCHPIGWIVKPVAKSDLAEILSQMKSNED